MSNKIFDIIIFGATSFIGKLLVEHLHQQPYDKPFNWAIAGRNVEKLQQLCDALNIKDVPLLIADAFDEEALHQMCMQTKVVISTVGPYALYGDLLLKICANNGIRYCDLCGETPWIRKMIVDHQAQAHLSGALLINACGFDSIPSDMGVYFLQAMAQQRFGEQCHLIKMRCKAMKGGLSGGTIASMLNITKEIAANPQLLKMLANPYSLCVDKHSFHVRQEVVKGAFYDADFASWCSPFIMAGINTRIVHRSNALLNNAYSDSFKYSEATLTYAGAKGWLKAQLRTLTIGLFFLFIAIKPLRFLLEKYLLPKPGQGPSKAARDAGFFDLHFIGYTSSGKSLRIQVTGDKDPGYGSTAKMLAQAALSLAFDDYTHKQGGLWTPASFFDMHFIQCLEKYAGLKFKVLD